MSRFLYAATLLLLGACKATAPVAPDTPSQGISLPYQQPVAVASGAGPIRLTLTEVADSRCPAGAQCIWAGEARVALELSEGDQPAQTLRLGLNPGPKLASSLPDSLPLTLHQQPYWIRLLSVAPFPALGGNSEPKMATVRLRAQ